MLNIFTWVKINEIAKREYSLIARNKLHFIYC